MKSRTNFDRGTIRHLLCAPLHLHHAERAAHAHAQTVGGGAAFVAVLALSQALQGFVLRVSCATPLGVPTALGEMCTAVVARRKHAYYSVCSSSG